MKWLLKRWEWIQHPAILKLVEEAVKKDPTILKLVEDLNELEEKISHDEALVDNGLGICHDELRKKG